MSRILLLLVFLLWMTGTSHAMAPPPDGPAVDAALFLGFYGLLIVVTGLWGRRVARRVIGGEVGRSVRRFNNLMLLARLMTPAWFAAGMFGLGWGWIVEHHLGLAALLPARAPSLIVGTLPAIIAWAGLWWSQYPLDRALREQHVWNQLEEGLPVHRPPGFGAYFVANLRLQILFTLAPVLFIVGVRDVAAVVFFDHSAARRVEARSGRGDVDLSEDAAGGDLDPRDALIEFITFLGSAGVVFVFAPALLRRVLKTSPLPDSPLRRRLQSLCRRTGMRYRDILVWHTEFNMGNAAVMGVIPAMRYILLSDLLLERMDDEQIEAVFAHEIGHVVHRHMIWYVVFFLTLLLIAAGPGSLAVGMWEHLGLSPLMIDLVALSILAAGFWIVFGFISRRFERQADVYAARVIESAHGGRAGASLAGDSPLSDPWDLAHRLEGAELAPISESPVHHTDSHVGLHGAMLFASALHRVATINNIPISPRTPREGGLLQRVGYVLGSFMDLAHDWLHGSIPHRMAYLQTLSGDPALTGRFDRVMTRLYSVLLFALFASAAWTWMAVR